MSEPTVFIGVPVFNGGDHLEETLESIRTQTLDDLEIVVADNCSDDATEEIGRDFASRDERFRFVRHDRNLGAAPNCNFLHAEASGKYFKWAAHDDVLAPRYLEVCVGAMEDDDGIVLAHTAPDFIEGDGTLVPYDSEADAYIDRAGYHWQPDPPRALDDPRPDIRFSEIVRRTIITQEIFGVMRSSVLGPGPHFRSYYGSDRVLLARMALLGRFFESPEKLFLRRCYAEQASQQSTEGRADVVDPENAEATNFAVGRIARGYVKAVLEADIDRTTQGRCMYTLGAHTVNRRTLRKLFVPGPYNYFGIDPSKKAAA